MMEPGVFGGIFWATVLFGRLVRCIITTPAGWISITLIALLVMLSPTSDGSYRRNNRLTSEENQIMRELDNERRIRQQEYWQTR